MRKLIILITIIFTLSASASEKIDEVFTDEEKNYIASNVFTLGMIADNYPFSFKENNVLAGFSYDYMNLVIKKSGLKIKVEMGTWIDTLNKFRNKKIDLIDVISYTKSREAFTHFSEPYFEIASVVFAREDDFNDYVGFESLKGKKVGITQDLYYYDEIKALNLFELVTFENSRDKVKALAYGDVDAIFNNLITGQKYIKNFGYSHIKILGELDNHIVKKEDLRIGVKKEDQILFSIINKSIEAISREEREVLIDKWFAAKNTTTESSLSLTDEETQYLKEKKVIEMCVAPNRLPFEQIDKDGIFKGIGADIIELISKKINTPIKLIPTNKWSASLQNIRDRKCDILPVVMDLLSRRDAINFTKPYMSEPLVIATKDDELFIKDIESIGKNKVGILKGGAISVFLKQKNPEISLVEVKNVKEGLSRVNNGELFGFVGVMSAVGYYIQKNSFVDLKIAGRLEHDIKISIGSRNDEVLLNSIMQKTLNNIGEDRIRAITGEWIRIKVDQSVDYLKLIYISGFFSIIFLLILYRHRAIKRINEKLALLNNEIEEKNIILEQLAVTDKLTGLYNRRKLDEVLVSECRRAKRFSHTFGIIMVDIDYFKKVNDEFGHQMGDTVLQEFSRIIKSNSRETDIVGRWGGEEFVIISAEINLAGILSLANKLQNAVASYPFMLGEQKTASFGVAVYRKNEEANELIKRADNALYRAKEKGRNRVETG